jgi:hypothetical protein
MSIYLSLLFLNKKLQIPNNQLFKTEALDKHNLFAKRFHL